MSVRRPCRAQEPTHRKSPTHGCGFCTDGHITLPVTSLHLLYPFDPTDRLYLSWLVLWPLPHRPNGSKRFYGCPHGNHSVNGGLCCMLSAFTMAEKHMETGRAASGETTPTIMVRMNTGIDAMRFREEVYFKMWISFMAMKSFILYLISCSGFCFVSMMQGECFHCIWMY